METTNTAAPVPAAVLRDVEKRMSGLARFAGVDHRIAPNAFRKPFSHKNWRALPEDIRLQNIRARLTEQIAGQHAERSSRPAEPKAAEAKAKTAEPSPIQASRYLVPCADGCGKFHPARNAKPVLIMCRNRRADLKPRPADRGDKTIEEKLAQLRRSQSSRD
ncbi:hypothetical protein [Paenarthrobacter sp. YIM B13468]|uniref:hypothetical protein n=1 Tax=Paenarthrobacter sp. YIM B13468 TaxID=3366295 RepID=UPI00366F9858